MSIRFKEEFYCQECHKYFLTFLRDNFYGNYTIECPNCGHHHYRIIKEGLVTEQRHQDQYEQGKSELILGLKATLKDTPWHNDPDFKRQQFKVINGG